MRAGDRALMNNGCKEHRSTRTLPQLSASCGTAFGPASTALKSPSAESSPLGVYGDVSSNRSAISAGSRSQPPTHLQGTSSRQHHQQHTPDLWCHPVSGTEKLLVMVRPRRWLATRCALEAPVLVTNTESSLLAKPGPVVVLVAFSDIGTAQSLHAQRRTVTQVGQSRFFGLMSRWIIP